MDKETKNSLLIFGGSLIISTCILSTLFVSLKRDVNYDNIAQSVYDNALKMVYKTTNMEADGLVSFFYNEENKKAEFTSTDKTNRKIIYFEFESTSLNSSIASLSSDPFNPNFFRRTWNVEDIVEDEYINEKAVGNYMYAISNFEENYHISTTYLCSCGSYISKNNYLYNKNDHQIVNDGQYLSIPQTEKSVVNSLLQLIINN